MRDFDWYILVSLHETGNITKSAELLFITQPALTKRLQGIEQDLGCTLVIRSQKGITFTPVGELVVQQARSIVSAITGIKNSIARQHSVPCGKLVIGSPYSFVRSMLPALLEEYVKFYPLVEVDIQVALSDELVQRTRQGLVECCFARCPIDDISLVRQTIGEERCIAVYSQPFSVEELPKLPYIGYMQNSFTQAALNRWWNERFSVPLTPRFIVNNPDACLSMIEHHLGYSIFYADSYLAGKEHFQLLPLTYKNGQPFLRKTSLVYRSSALDNPATESFVRFVSDYFPKKNCTDV